MASHQLHWVHGYSCRLARGAVRYSSEGNIVYPAAALGTVQPPPPYSTTDSRPYP